MSTTPDDLLQLRAAVRGALGGSEQASVPTVDEHWRKHWPELSELGLAGLCAPEHLGGSGFEVAAAAAVAQEMGAALHGSPYPGLTAAVVALGSTGHEPFSALARDLVSGERLCVFGNLDHSGRTARNVGGAPEADALLLHDPRTGEILVLTDPGDWTVEGTMNSFDLSRTTGDVTVRGLDLPRIRPDVPVQDIFRLLLVADAIGCLTHALGRTVDYARHRVAFGKPIGGLQAVQHRLADHAVRVRGMSLAVEEAARMLGEGHPGAHRQVVLAEIAVTSRATHLLHDLLQLTGGIGFTWEYGLHFFERRADQDARLGTNPRAAIRALASVEGWAR